MMFTPLSEIASVSLGYKSLQNRFFYLNAPTIDTYGIEGRFLTPIFTVGDLDATLFLQNARNALWLFNCAERRADLRGTGALKYIDSMANQPAAEKKQSGKVLTIKEALEAQGGAIWYAPKARPNKHHIWLRKAIHGTFAPFLFRKAELVDQRCNSISPLRGVEWELVAAVISSSLFAYSVEVNGSAGLGAGALEATTRNLRHFPIFDVRALNATEQKRLVALARAVWDGDEPVDWSAGGRPGAALQALDEWILRRSGKDLAIEGVYRDIADVCRARILVAQDKVKKTKKKRTDNIENVAESIAHAIRPRLALRNFPEDFVDTARLDMNFDVDAASLRAITFIQILDRHDVILTTGDGTKTLDVNYPTPVAEGMVRAVLWGRSAFAMSSDPKVMKAAVSRFLKWVGEIDAEIDTAIRESALGTGYEDALRRAIYVCLGVSPLSGCKELPSEIPIAGAARL